MALRNFTRLFSVQSKLKTNPIENNFEKEELKIKINDAFATVTYKKMDNNTYDLLHTSIPEIYQGQGLGSILAERIFDHLIQSNKKIKVTCEYLQKYVSTKGEKYKNSILDSNNEI
ncbi:protein NATD1-like [Anoplophora glabripennis]|uniref:protein NATD1-like n=1 Tax=Anoplophora glabripennis TaxID=217634 RepID=UPI0008755EA7|nr:protein NATD1-like [Anoplophora glabripennis]